MINTNIQPTYPIQTSEEIEQRITDSSTSLMESISGSRRDLREEMGLSPGQSLIDGCRLGEGAKFSIGKTYYEADKFFAQRKIVDGKEVFGEKLSDSEIYCKMANKIAVYIQRQNDTLDINPDVIDELIYPASQHFMAEMEALHLCDKNLQGYLSPHDDSPCSLSFNLESISSSKAPTVFVTTYSEKQKYFLESDLIKDTRDPKPKILTMEVKTYHNLINHEVGFSCLYKLDNETKSWISTQPWIQESDNETIKFFKKTLRIGS